MVKELWLEHTPSGDGLFLLHGNGSKEMVDALFIGGYVGNVVASGGYVFKENVMRDDKDNVLGIKSEKLPKEMSEAPSEFGMYKIVYRMGWEGISGEYGV